MISQKYREMNRQLHEDPNFGAQGDNAAPMLAEFIEKNQIKTVLDYGAGKQRLANALREISKVQVDAYDPALPEIAEVPQDDYDLVVCTDVLEHIEPDWLTAVLDHQAALTNRYCWNVVCRVPAKRILPDGRNAHLIVQPHTWWEAKFSENFKVLSHEEQETHSQFWLKPN